MQKPSSPTTRFEVLKRQTVRDDYAQRIPMWKAVERLGSVNRSELLTELRRMKYERPNGASVDEAYCRTELTDMTKRGFLRRLD